ncbi:rho GTPase-activating protein 26 [Hetaerina americana]|uniref:rho GTPase-activating protein 26 n=1 Tax=Hetaerina americana TaxID=62018 RepID=UPI003A7F52E4
MGLQPLEFTECLSDSPYFRENLHAHEQVLDETSQQIKGLIKEVKYLINAAQNLSKAQRTLSTRLQNFNFECIGTSQTEDEAIISGSLRKFGRLIADIEDERDRMLDRAHDQIVAPLEAFRKERIGGVKEGKKKFEKQTSKFCQSQERYLNLSTKKQDTVLREADAYLGMEKRHFFQASLEYVFLIQEVQERKKFEFVETLLGFMYGWLTFYHQGHEVANDFKPFMRDLQLRIQKTRENFEATRDKTESLMRKMLEKPLAPGQEDEACMQRGYLFLMEKKAFGTTWTKQYCEYNKKDKEFTMKPYNQISGKFTPCDRMTLTSCTRRMSDSIEKRFCFDVTSEDRPGIVYTLQALSEEDRKLWMDAMDGKEPTYLEPPKSAKANSKPPEPGANATNLDEIGFAFVNRCIEVLEARGLEEQGIYRIVGVSSKVNRLLNVTLDRRKLDRTNLEDVQEWETKTITSALKAYLRGLPEPLMTFQLHDDFVAAAKLDLKEERINQVHRLVHQLPKQNFSLLDTLVKHLRNVVSKSDKNLMTVSNIGVCFGPTLLRPQNETVAAIMEIKFCNIVVEILVEHHEKIFQSQPPEPGSPVIQKPPAPSTHPVSFSPTPHPSSPSSSSSSSASPSLLEGGAHRKPSHPPPPPYLMDSSSRRRQVHQQPMSMNQRRPFMTEPPPPLPSIPPQLPPWRAPPNSRVAPVRPHRSDVNRQPLPYAVSRLPGESVTGSPPAHLPNFAQEQSWAHPVAVISRVPHPARRRHHRRVAKPLHHGSPTQDSRPAHVIRSKDHIMDQITGESAESSDDSGSSPSSRGDGDLHLDMDRALHGFALHNLGREPRENVRVRTLYACVGENDGELSFEPNQIITNVRQSQEPGWLEGMLNGKTGLIPENYVEVLP